MKRTKKSAIAVLQIFLLIISAVLIGNAAAGDVDTSFKAAVEIQPSGTIYDSKVQADGKIIIAGNFSVVNDVGNTAIARLNADGSVDKSFNAPTLLKGISNSIPSVRAVAIQNDGKILVGGEFETSFETGVIRSLIRLNTDGSLDASFNSSNLVSGGIVYDIEIQPDGKILIGGNFGLQNSARRSLVRFLPNGDIDTTFSSLNLSFVKDLLIQPDGKIVYTGQDTPSGNFILRRLNSDGTSDSSFAVNTFSGSGVSQIIRQTDGKIIAVGGFELVNGFSQKYIARFNTDGMFDTTFDTSNSGINRILFSVDLLSNGKIIIGGINEFFSQIPGIRVLNADGTRDNTFNFPASNSNYTVYEINVISDDNILIGKQAARAILPLDEKIFSKIDSRGNTDANFSPAIGINGTVYRTKVQSDGKIIVVGGFYQANGRERVRIARFNKDGSLDESFNPMIYDRVSPFADFGPVDIQADGKILIREFRLNKDGSIDNTFKVNTAANVLGARDITVQPDGKIIYAGTMLRRVNSDGSIDNTFNVNFEGLIYQAVLQSDGKILIGGRFSQINGVNRSNIARLNSDGSVDTTFNPVGGANGFVYNIAVQSNGKILIVGGFTGVNFDTSHRYVARLNADGSLDNTFQAFTDKEVFGLKIEPSGKILIGGAFTLVNNVPRNYFARLNSDGSLDTTFNVGSGANDLVWEINLDGDNNILVGGAFSKFNNKSAVGIARLLNQSVPAKTLFDFDGDGRADISVFRPLTNRWYQFRSSNSQVFEATFGISGDVLAPADYDGDGKTDLGIFRPSTGSWWYLSSVDNGQKNVQFGANGDVPRPSDFDGDGKADYVLFRPSNNTWYRLGSTGATSNVQFGIAGDKPVTGDFDGDGKSDVAIFRPSTGTWWYQSSINNAQKATAFGIAADIPAAADYDGDGKTDFAVYRPSTGVWYILNSSNGGATIVNFGIAEDKPAAADYDGDGKADIAVYRPSSGVWYLLKSKEGFTQIKFGISTDVPIPNAFVP